MEKDRQADQDALIVVRSQLGEREALNALVERWATPLQHYLDRVGRDQQMTADLAQQVWLAVLAQLPRLRDPRRFRAWLFGIAHHRLMDRYRALKRQPESLDDDNHIKAEPIETPDPIQTQWVHQGLSRLPALERETLSLFYLEQLTLTEMAEALRVPHGTVKSRLHRARNQLKALMDDTEASL